MKHELHLLTLTKTITKLKSKEISHKELYDDVLSSIEKQKNLNIYLSLDKDVVKKAEKLRDTPLAGVPIAVKDNFLTVEFKTTASSNVLKNFKPQYESTVTKRIKAAGGVVIGKTNMDAWAHGSSTETSDFGPTRNPRNPEHLPGGSSGGSAAAVAANMCIASIGSETAGSIRQPAAWCGVVGMKPTYGRVSRYGLVAMASSIDSPGPLGKTVEDTAILLNHMTGYDVNDATSSKKPVESYTKHLGIGVKNMRIGICYTDHKDLKNLPAALAVEDAAKVFERLGANVDMVATSDTPVKGKALNPDFALAAYTVVQRSEVSSNLARYDGVRYGFDRSHFGTEAKRRIMLGTFSLSRGYTDKYYIQAQKVRNLFIENFRDLFTMYDVIISPTSPGFAKKLGSSYDNPMFGELEDMLIEPSSISGLTGINVPCFRDPKSNLYLGLNVTADQWQEEKVFQVAHAYEQTTQWNSWCN